MVILAVLCLVAAIVPDQIAAAFSRAGTWFSPEEEGKSRSLPSPGDFQAASILAIAGMAAALVLVVRRRTASGPTWGCGYAAPTPRMQYTGRSFAELVAERILPRFLRACGRRRVPTALFPAAMEYSADCADPVSQRLYAPFFARWAQRVSPGCAFLQQGKINMYLLYILFTIVLALAWTAVRGWVVGAS